MNENSMLSPSRIAHLDELVEELLKTTPQEEVLRKKMKDTGIPYSSDPVERINLVLKALHFTDENQTS